MRSFELKIFALLVFVFWAGPTAHAESAKMFKLTVNGDLSKVTGYNWSNRWTQIVPFSARGQELLLFYDRDRGRAKLFRYYHTGQMHRKETFSGWSKDWDHVIAGQFGEANMIFYNRVNGLLKAFHISETGRMSLKFEQTIENPVDASLISAADPPAGPGGPGWDIVTPVRWSWVGHRRVPGLLFYNRTEGRALFLRYDEIERHFVFAHRYQGWNNSWDEIKAADFNRDEVDDLVLYDQDGGKLKVIYMNEDYSFDSHVFLKDRGGVFAGRTHFSQLVIGNFGGGGGKDVLLYQQGKCPNGLDCVMDERGRGRLWTDNGRSGWNLNPKVYDNWSDDWTHVVPVKVANNRSTGLLFYRNQVTLKLVIWQVMETDRIGSASGVPPTRLVVSPWSNLRLTQVDTWIKVAKNTFKAAGIQFDATVKHGFDGMYDNEIVGWDMDIDFAEFLKPREGCLNGKRQCVEHREEGQSCSNKESACELVRGCSDIANLLKGWVWFTDQPSDTINAFVIPGTGTGCSWSDYNHLLVGRGSLSNPKHLSHELGHYFGLAHTFVSESLGGIKAKCKIPPSGSGNYSKCVSAIAKKLDKRKDELGRDVRFADLDNDHHTKNGSWVYDTPPVLNKVVTQHLRENTYNNRTLASGSGGFPGDCKPGARYTFHYPFNVPRASQSAIEMYQESHNVMNYTNCDGLFRISKDQARVIRQGLFRTDGDYGWRRGLVGN